MNARQLTLALALVLSFLGMGLDEALQAMPPRPEKKPEKEFVAFGSLRSVSLESARTQALDWLKSTGKTDAASMQAFEAIWSAPEGPSILERLARTFALGDAEADKLLKEASDPAGAAPTSVPPILQDETKPAFFRDNLALAYAKALSSRRIHEEALDVLRLIRKPDQVVDPAAYFCYRAVAEHALLAKEDAVRSATVLLEDVGDAPDRYQAMAVLMLVDMSQWKEKDLGEIARKMSNIERRLELVRGGPQTQKMQKEVVARLDEIIKKIENDQQGGGQTPPSAEPPPGEQEPKPGQPQGPTAKPMDDSKRADTRGRGDDGNERLRQIADIWGTLPPKERAKVIAELSRDLPPTYRDLVEKYFKKLAQDSSRGGDR